MKDRADLLEAFIGALYIDKDLEYCQVFAQVCFFPRLYQFITNQEWNDPKSKLQQCCLTLRTMERGEPDIPVYKVRNFFTHFDNIGPKLVFIFSFFSMLLTFTGLQNSKMGRHLVRKNIVKEEL